MEIVVQFFGFLICLALVRVAAEFGVPRACYLLLSSTFFWLVLSSFPHLPLWFRAISTLAMSLLLTLRKSMIAISIHRFNNFKNLLQLLYATSIYFAIHCLYLLILKSPVAALSFLGLGYDNAIHMGIFRYEMLVGGRIHFGGYPFGQGSLWSAFSALFGYSGATSRNLISSFAACLVATNILNVILISYLCKASKRKVSVLAILILVATYIVGSFSFIVVSGFHPYVLAVTLLLLLLVTLQYDSMNANTRVIPIFLAAMSTLFLAPPLVLIYFPLLFVAYRSNFFSLLSVRIKSVGLLRFCLYAPLIVSGAIGLAALTKMYGIKRVLDQGGIEPISNSYLLFFLGLFLIVLIVADIASNEISWFLLAGCIASVLFLLVITFPTLGSVGYYPMKQIYICLLISSVCVAVMALQSDYGIRASLLAMLLGISCSMQIVEAKTPDIFDSPYMGSGANAVRLIFAHKDEWGNQFIDAKTLLLASDKAQLSPQQCGMFWTKDRDATLWSRWLNAIQPSQGSECFDVYFDSNQQSDEQVLSELQSPNYNVTLIVLERPLSHSQIDQITKYGERVVILK